jgi:preprotein translocase subunit SecF
MEFFKIRRSIPFMRHAKLFNIISLITFLLSVVFLVTRGLNLSIEFTGGMVMEVAYKNEANVEQIRGALEKAGIHGEVTGFGTSREALIRLPLKKAEGEAAKAASQGAMMTQQAEAVTKVLRAQDPSVEVRRTEFVGGQVGGELATDGAMALLFVVFGIMIYLAFRFEWRFSVATIIANLHDIVIILGFFAFFQWEFSLPVLAAILAILGYSVNESVVVFDRVRENFRKMRKATVPEIMDASITGTISRTIITHGSTQMMVLSILFFGGLALHNFALALTIGILFGIYSSVLVAAPLAMYLGASREDFVKPEKKADTNPRP